MLKLQAFGVTNLSSLLLSGRVTLRRLWIASRGTLEGCKSLFALRCIARRGYKAIMT
jgi:hypothetical protein